MDFANLDDTHLENMRLEAKRVMNPRARDAIKRGHVERNYDVVSVDDPTRRYRIFVRQSRFEQNAFSAGLLRVYASGETLVLVRYNGASHPHRNRIERSNLGIVSHIHVAKATYLQRGMSPDGFAVECARFSTVKGALRRLVEDCNVIGLKTDPEEPELPF